MVSGCHAGYAAFNVTCLLRIPLVRRSTHGRGTPVSPASLNRVKAGWDLSAIVALNRQNVLTVWSLVNLRPAATGMTA